MPRCIIPDQEQGTLTLPGKVTQEPCQECACDLTDRTTRDKAYEHLRQRGNVQSITRHRFHFGIGLGNFLFDQAERLIGGPRMNGRLFLATPPGFVLKAKDDVGIRFSQPDESFALFLLTHTADPGSRSNVWRVSS